MATGEKRTTMEKPKEQVIPVEVAGELRMLETRQFGEVTLSQGASIGRISLMKGITRSMLEKLLVSRGVQFDADKEKSG